MITASWLGKGDVSVPEALSMRYVYSLWISDPTIPEFIYTL